MNVKCLDLTPLFFHNCSVENLDDLKSELGREWWRKMRRIILSERPWPEKTDQAPSWLFDELWLALAMEKNGIRPIGPIGDRVWPLAKRPDAHIICDDEGLHLWTDWSCKLFFNAGMNACDSYG